MEINKEKILMNDIVHLSMFKTWAKFFNLNNNANKAAANNQLKEDISVKIDNFSKEFLKKNKL